MKFTVERDVLHDGLSAVASRTKGATSIPILSHVLVTASGDGVSLMSHDTASCCIAKVPAEVASPGECAIPADRLSKLVAGLPKGGTIVAEATDQQVTIRCGRASYRFPVLPAADFPGALVPKDPTRIELTNEDIRRAFKVTSLAVIEYHTRPYLSGVCLHEKGGLLHAVGTDGHRLIRVGTNAKVKKFERVIVPRAALAEIVNVAGKAGATIEISSNLFAVESGGRRFVSRLIDGTYPEYERLIPQQSQQPFAVDASALDAALSRLMAASDTRPCVRLSWADDGNMLASLRSELGEGSEEVECEHGGKPAGEIGMQLQYVRDLIEAANGKTIELHIAGPGEVCRFDNPNDKSFVAICLPIRL